MKLNSSKLFFLAFMMIGVMMCLSSNNWIMIWCGLEISLITFLPIMSSKMIMTSESSIKYFLVQSVSSSLLILSMMIMLSSIHFNEILMSAALMIKMGVAPFHNWVLSIIEGLKFYSVIIMLTILKISPLMLMSYLKISLIMIILITLIVGSLFGLNQSSTRKIMAYSSIFNMGLILSVLTVNINWTLYFCIYSGLVSMVMITLHKTNSNYVNQLIISDKSLVTNFSIWFILLSMGGMPPFLGFSAKLIVIEYLIMDQWIMTLVVIIFCSLIVMFFYMRMTYMSIMFFSLKPKMSIINSNDYFPFIITMINLLSLPLILLIKSFI